MKLSTEIGIGLKRLANPSLVSDDNLDKLLLEASSVLSDHKSQRKVDIKPSTPKIDILKECYSSLICLLVESARRNVDPSGLNLILEGYKFSSQRTDKILRLYASQQVEIEKSLAKICTEPPHIFDVTWKLNLCVKSSFSDLESKEVYFIDFHVGREDSTGNRFEMRKITFVCTVQHLQELVWKLKAATRQLESIANVNR